MQIALFELSQFARLYALILYGNICLIISIFSMLAFCRNISLYPRRYTSI
jgi:hypothetical protein